MKNMFHKAMLKKSEIFRKAAAVASALAIVLGFTANAVPMIVAADGSGSADGIAIDETNFPDAAFRQYVSENIDNDGSGYLSDSEIAAVTSVSVEFGNISDMKGIEYFTALTMLCCYQNQLTALDVSQNTALEALDCHNNQLTALDVSQNTALTWLDCYNNQLTALDVSQNTALERLDCYNNQLTALDVSQNTALEMLYCNNNRLTALDVSQNTALTVLQCNNNRLTALDVSQNAALERLDCYNNQLTALDVSQNTALTRLYCNNNQLTALDASGNAALTMLDCYGNQLTALDVSKNAALTDLLCYNNRLTALDVSKNAALTTLLCYNNRLTALDVSKNAALTDLLCNNNRLTELDVSQNAALTQLSCNNNQLTALDVSQNTALRYFGCNDNKYTVCGSEVAIADLPGSFDPSKASEWTNAEVKDGKIISGGYCTATYTYDCGNSETAEFSIEFSKSLIAINETNFPDAAFRQYVSENIDNDNSGYLSDSEIAAVTHIYAPYQDISDMKGIEYFTALTELYCYDNQLTELDVSQNTALEMLYCFNNQLTALDVSQNTALIYLECTGNQLTELDVSQNTALEMLYCFNNQLTALDVSQNAALTELYCDSNQLTELDVSQNTALIYLECTGNQLTELDVSQNTALTELYCYNNRLTALDVSQNAALIALDCHNNQLTALDVSQNTALTELYCHSNQLTALDVSQNTALRYFGCNDNKYTVCGSEVAIADLPGSFDPSKATNWTNAKAEDGKIISEDFCTVTYTYDCGNNKTETFSIEFIEHTGGTATCTQKAICDTCGEEYGELEAHTLTKTDAVPATCTAAGNEAYWTCSECGKMFSDEDGTTEIQSIPTIPILGHDYGNDWKSDSGSHWHECAVCGDKIDSAAHTEDGGTVTKEPTKTETGIKTYKCSVCGYVIRTETIDKLPPSHEHSYSTDWKTDEDGHWHECECGDRIDSAAHTEDSGTVTKAPTETETGIKTYKCSVCGYVIRTEIIDKLPPSHEHSYGTDWKSDEDGHWHECECGDRIDSAAHTEDSGTVTKAPTETETGIRTYYCTVCRYEMRTETIDKLPPSHEHSYGTDWKSDADSHWHECTVCGDKIDSAAHTEDNGTVTKQPTASEMGERTYKCTVCGNVIRTETIGKLPSGGGDFVTPTEPTDPTEPSDPADPTTPDEPITPSRPDNEVPFIKDENGKNGWEVINEEIDKAEGGSTVNVDMNGATVVPGNIFDTLRGRDVTVVFDMGGGITWSVNGKDVTFDNTSDIDFSVKSDTENIPVDVINNITGERYSIQISLAHNGKFGFTAVLSINLGSGNAGQKAALYYYDGGALEFICESEISADGTARLKFTHASDYLIVIGESQTDEGDTSDTTSGESNPSEDDNSGTTSGATSSVDISEPGKKDPDEQDGNPSTGVATSLIPLAIAAAFIVAAAKRKIK